MGEPELVWQNQRFLWGLGWRPPGLLERSAWTDLEGRPVDLAAPPQEGSELWEPVVLQSTDAEGWQYASFFKHFESPREGGRASQRAGDFVRRRQWRRTDTTSGSAPAAATPAQRADAADMQRSARGKSEQSLGEKAANAAGAAANKVVEVVATSATQLQSIRHRKQTEADKRKSVFKIFINMFTESIKRHTLWNLMPLDPAAWYVVYNQHQVDFKQMEAAQRAKQREVSEADRQQLSRELLCAAMHSRAAYGYAMKAGHLASIYSFAVMQTVAQLSFDAAGGASGEANNDAVTMLAGIQPGHIIMSEWNNSVMRPCHYVAVDHANRCIVLAIRGSLEVGDVLSDLSANPMEVCLVGVQGRVHPGMMAAATYVHCNTAQALEAAARNFPGWPLFLTGHSMGGGVACILAALLKDGAAPEGLGPVQAVAVGPAAVFSKKLAEACRPFVTSVVLRSDIVARLSYASVENAFLELINASPMRRAAKEVGRKVTETLGGLKVDWSVSKKPPHLNKDSGQHAGLGGAVELASDRNAADAAARTATSASHPDPPERERAVVDAAQYARAFGETAARSDRPVMPASDYAMASPLVASGILAGRLRSPTKGLKRTASGNAHAIADVPHINGQARACGAPLAASERAQPAEGPARADAASRRQHGTAQRSAPQQGDSDQVGEGSSAEADRDEVADILGVDREAGVHPELLYPAGRILWLLPSEEAERLDEVASTSDAAAEDEGYCLPLTFSGGLLPDRTSAPVRQSQAALGGQPPAYQQEAGRPSADGMDREGGKSATHPSAPAVLDVPASCFARLLFSADMMNDHLPDSYLHVIKQL
ncbi:hypothetical protein WJX72_010311 [[Myrmecia] bisecta]|uniref:sn-1-specific diacylglycerol lipase n=1 Tax=[Myrmecia] bisecta TaxID=41462 RepID=A0AAW1QTL8_9CHLO